MIDLRISQENAGDRRNSDAVVPRRERLELLARIRRGIDEEPRSLVPTNRQRRLRTRARAFADARGLTRLAMAIPLRKSPAGGRAQNSNSHVWHHRDAAQGAAPAVNS